VDEGVALDQGVVVQEEVAAAVVVVVEAVAVEEDKSFRNKNELTNETVLISLAFSIIIFSRYYFGQLVSILMLNYFFY
jgi:hypothetical protein